MGSKAATLVVEIITDAARANAGFDQAASGAEKWEQQTAKAAKAASLVFAATTVAVVATTQAAANQQQAFSAVSAVFKEGAPAVQEWAKQQAKIGLSATDAAQNAAYLGAMLKNAGYDAAGAASESQRLITLAHDMAATFGGSTKDAVEALGASLRGETDPMERFGVSILQSDINAKLAEKGLTGLTGAAKKNAEATARLELITLKTADAQGSAAKNSDSLIERQRKLGATMDNLSASIGQAFLPVAERMAGVFLGIASAASAQPGIFSALLIAVGLFSGAVIALNVGLRAYIAIQSAMNIVAAAYTAITNSQRVAIIVYGTAIRAVTAAQWLWNAAMMANPMGLIVLAVIAVIAVIVLLWTKCDWFRNAVTAIFSAIGAVFTGFATIVGNVVSWIGEHWQLLIALILGPLGIIVGLVITHWDTIKNVIMTVVGIVIDWIGRLVAGFMKIVDVGKTVGSFFISFYVSYVKFLIDGFMKLIDAAKNVGHWFGDMADSVRNAFSRLGDFVQALWDRVSAIIDKIKNGIRGAIDFINPFKESAPELTITHTFGLGSAGGSSGGPFSLARLGSEPVVIVQNHYQVEITGQLVDPEGSARAIEQLLSRSAHRNGAQPFSRMAPA